VRGAGTTHDNGKDVYLLSWSMALEGIGGRVVFISDKLRAA
jgi:hypothetical protein